MTMNASATPKFAKVLLISMMVVAAAACSKKVKETPPPPAEPTTTQPVTEQPTTPGAYTPESLDTDACLRQRVVYFDFNETNIKPQFQAAISCHAAYLRQFPGARVTLQGNADERGTREYNLGLGERRSNAVSGALGAAGASTAQLNVVSYGEERPVCKDHSEDCWQKNRRVEVVYTSKQ